MLQPPVPLPLESDRPSRPAAVPWSGGHRSPRSGQRRRDRPGMGRRRAKPSDLLPLFGALALLCGGCLRPQHHSSGRVFPLMRHTPGDGLAVVNAPGGSGIHIWLDPDTETAGICRPRWNPDPARLSGGDGASPTSSGRAPREEFYAALRRGPVRWALRRQMEELCRHRAPGRRFQWQGPPRSDAAFLPVLQPQLEEEHLLSNPTAVRRTEKQLLGIPLTPEDWNETRPPRPPDGP